MGYVGSPFTREALAAAMSDSMCWAHTLRRLGYEPKGSNFRTVQRWARMWGLSSDHFDPNAARGLATRKRGAPLEQLLVENSTSKRGNIKARLFAAGLKERRCELCGQGEEWRGRRMSLILDHINGVADDHRLENLQIVCPNCNATLDTHCGRNVPRERTCPGCGDVFAPRNMHHRYCSRRCLGRLNSERRRGISNPSRRIVDRPPLAQLRAEISALGFSAVGRKYGVSDNAVRKWLVFYERSEVRAERRPAPDPPG